MPYEYEAKDETYSLVPAETSAGGGLSFAEKSWEIAVKRHPRPDTVSKHTINIVI